MTAVVILEDERPARERLEQAILSADPAARIVGAFASVADATHWLAHHETPDVVFADVQLADGLSLEIFDRIDLGCPVIFCTAYDEYLVDALARNGIDYLLKPIHDRDVARALAKYRRLHAHFAGRLTALRESIQPSRRRLVARSSQGFVVLAVDDIAYFTLHDGTVTATTQAGIGHTLDRTLTDLEAQLDSHEFFRLNRQVLARATAIVGFRPYFKGRLLIDLNPPTTEEVVVSQENAARFKAWLG